MVAAFLLVLGAPTSVVWPATSLAATAPAADQREIAALLDRMRPRQMAIDAEMRVFETTFASSLLAQEDVAQLEKENPGTVAAITAAMRPVLASYVPKDEDRLRTKLTSLLKRELSQEEVTSLLAFYSSPAASVLVQQLINGGSEAAAKQNVAEMMASDKITPKQIDGMKQRLVDEIEFSQDQQTALLNFQNTPGYAALQRINPKMSALAAEHLNAPDPAFDADLDRVITKAIEDHLAKSAQGQPQKQ